MAQVTTAETAPLSPSAGVPAWVSIGLSICLPFAVALVLVPFRVHFSNTAAALVLVAVIVGVAAFGDRRAGWIASVSSCVWFDFFLTRPYERFSIASARDVETTIALLVVGFAVTEIAVRSRQHFAVAMEEGNYLALIHDGSDLIAQGATPEAIVGAARENLVELLGLEECRFAPSGRPQWAAAKLMRTGEVERGEERFDVEHEGLPAGEVELEVQSQGRSYGVFVMVAGKGRGVSIEKRIVALVLADQVGAALAGASPDRST